MAKQEGNNETVEETAPSPAPVASQVEHGQTEDESGPGLRELDGRVRASNDSGRNPESVRVGPVHRAANPEDGGEGEALGQLPVDQMPGCDECGNTIDTQHLLPVAGKTIRLCDDCFANALIDWGAKVIDPEQMPGKCPDETETPNARSDVSVDTSTYKPNARQIPGKYPASARTVEVVDWGQMPVVEAINDRESFDSSSGYEDLWRLEKDGPNYRWRLRFVPGKVSRKGGRINANVRRLLSNRPGKGRHAKSRGDADRLRRRAEFAAIGIRSGSQRRLTGKDQPSSDTGRAIARPNDSDIGSEQMREVSELDQWENMPDLPVM